MFGRWYGRGQTLSVKSRAFPVPASSEDESPQVHVYVGRGRWKVSSGGVIIISRGYAAYLCSVYATNCYRGGCVDLATLISFAVSLSARPLSSLRFHVANFRPISRRAGSIEEGNCVAKKCTELQLRDSNCHGCRLCLPPVASRSERRVVPCFLHLCPLVTNPTRSARERW